MIRGGNEGRSVGTNEVDRQGSTACHPEGAAGLPVLPSEQVRREVRDTRRRDRPYRNGPHSLTVFLSDRRLVQGGSPWSCAWRHLFCIPNWYFRKAVPEHLQSWWAGRQRSSRFTPTTSGCQTPVGQAAADLQARWDQLHRQPLVPAGQRALHDPRKIVAMAGEFYQDLMRRYGKDPGPAKFWHDKLDWIRKLDWIQSALPDRFMRPVASEFQSGPSGRRRPPLGKSGRNRASGRPRTGCEDTGAVPPALRNDEAYCLALSPPSASAQPFDRFGFGHGPADEISLSRCAPQFSQAQIGVEVLYAFGNG